MALDSGAATLPVSAVDMTAHFVEEGTYLVKYLCVAERERWDAHLDTEELATVFRSF